MNLRRIVAVAFLGFAAPLFAADPTPAPVAKLDPSLEQLKKDICFLAGEECEGRGLKTKGILKASEYIADTFKEAGLKPCMKDGTYFQPFNIVGRSTLGTPNSLVLSAGDEKIELKYKDDFIATMASTKGKKSTGVVFVGYGCINEDQKYDDYAGVDVKGKLVVIMRRVPLADDKKQPFPEELSTFTAKIENAVAKGVAGILFVSDLDKAGKNDDLIDGNNVGGTTLEGPVFHIKRAIIDKMLKQAEKPTLAEIEKTINDKVKPMSFELKNWKAESETNVNRTMFNCRNVVGVLEGAGPLKDETVVIGAHYDHLGMGDEGRDSLDPKPAGKMHFGADDNGSGTTGLLELARRFGAMKNRQGRRIVFIAFSGEEKGLYGSIQYVKAPAFPLDKTIFMINMDMIGRVAEVVADKEKPEVKKDRIVVYGTGTAKGLDEFVDATNKKFDFKLIKVPGGSGPSDHTSFYNKKIPVLHMFSGTHKDYHRPSDTPDKINLAGLKKVVDFVEICAEHYATTTDKVEYLRTRGGGEDPTDPRPTTRSAAVPRLGIMPNYFTENGVGIEAVTADGPADKAGLKEEDLIIEIAGKSVKNMTAYMEVMGKQKPGEEMEIVVLRKDKKLTVKIVPLPPR